MQADLRLYWSHIPHCWKSHVTAHLLLLFIVHLKNFVCSNEGENQSGNQTFQPEFLDLCIYFNPFLLRPMEFPIKFDTVKSGWSIEESSKILRGG